MKAWTATSIPKVDKHRIARRFQAAAATYDAAAVLQRKVADRLVERLSVVRAKPNVILDAGCGTGYCTRLLSRRYRRARVVGIDLVRQMAVVARQKARWFSRTEFVTGDVERLPFTAGAFDMIASNFVLPWCDPATVFAEFLRVMRRDGLLVFTTLGPDTLTELRAAWREANPEMRPHLFLDMHDVGDALIRAGFIEPVMDVERYTLTYPSVDRLLQDLKALGIGSASAPTRTSLMGRSRFDLFRSAYTPSPADGKLHVTCEVVFGHAWAPAVTMGDRRVIEIRSA